MASRIRGEGRVPSVSQDSTLLEAPVFGGERERDHGRWRINSGGERFEGRSISRRPRGHIDGARTARAERVPQWRFTMQNGHNGPEITAAGWSVVQRRAGNPVNPTNVGFFRPGLRPIAEDVGFGGKDDFSVPMFAPGTPNSAGTFKAPGLRNIEFTGPYFHNGSQANLEQVLLFYSRNGDFPGDENLEPGIGNPASFRPTPIRKVRSRWTNGP